MAQRWPDQFRYGTPDTIPFDLRMLGASPVLETDGECPQVRIRRSRTDDAVLCFLHNRSNEDTVLTLREEGVVFVFKPDAPPSQWEERYENAQGVRLLLPAKSARMLVFPQPKPKNGHL